MTASENPNPPAWRMPWKVTFMRLGLFLGGTLVAGLVVGTFVADDSVDLFGGPPHDLTGFASSIMVYPIMVGWWVDRLAARRGWVINALVHVVAATAWAASFTSESVSWAPSGAVVLASTGGMLLGVLAARGVRGSFPHERSAVASSDWRRSPSVTLQRWLRMGAGMGIVSAVGGFILDAVFNPNLDSEGAEAALVDWANGVADWIDRVFDTGVYRAISHEAIEGIPFGLIVVLSMGLTLTLMFSWWVDHLAARQGFLQALLVHVAVALAFFALIAPPMESELVSGQNWLPTVAALLIGAVGAVAGQYWARRVPGSFADERQPAIAAAPEGPA